MDFLGVPLYDDDFLKLGVRFLFNTLFLTLVVGLAILPNLKKKDFAFAAVMMNVTVFFICFTLKKLELELGMVLGLFAIFGVLRFRTDAIRAKEMTYLFVVIGLAVVNALSNKKTSYAELVTVNVMILIVGLVMERFTRPAAPEPKLTQKTSVTYDKLQLLGTEHREELLADLKSRTGINITRFEVKGIDLGKSVATLTIWYDRQPGDVSDT